MNISSISINGVLTMDLHSLNNEGGEGNQTLTRQVVIVDKEGNIQTVNGISGDMFKHIQDEHLYNISLEKKLSLCNSCKVFDANRISGDTEFTEEIKGKKDGGKLPDQEVLDKVIQKCVIDDLEGILITNDGRNLPRKSCVEFGWIVGIPDSVKTENYFHVKFVPNAKKDDDSKDDGSNMGQNIFYRPANSGQYATICNLDLYRIGYNDMKRKYSINDEERNNRYKALLRSLLYTYIKPEGAMRNTQNPHLVDFSGAITVSKGMSPAPTVSPLNPNYLDEIKNITDSLNKIENIIDLYQFNNFGEFTDIMTNFIKEGKPYKLKLKE